MKIYKEIKECRDLNCIKYTYQYNNSDHFDTEVTYYCDDDRIKNLSLEERRLGSDPNFCEKCPVLQQIINSKFDDDKIDVILMM